MNANDAKKLVVSAHDDQDEKAKQVYVMEINRKKEEKLANEHWWREHGYSILQHSIEDAAKLGKTNITHDQRASDEIVDKLRKEGFIVEVGRRMGTESYCSYEGQAFREAMVSFTDICWEL